MRDSFIQPIEKTALFSFIDVSSPTEWCFGAVYEDFCHCWVWTVLEAVKEEFELETLELKLYVPANVSNYHYVDSTPEKRKSLLQTHLDACRFSLETKLKFYLKIMQILTKLRKLDGRGSVMLRNLRNVLDLDPNETMELQIIWTEEALIRGAHLIDHDREVTQDDYRYVKIGAVAAGAGVILAITGGLCAPLIVVGLHGMGASAAGITALSMATLFGGLGAGLGGYRMKNRTEGLTEFRFQRYDDSTYSETERVSSKMEVVVMVSGWMEEDEDDKRTFGVLPEQMSLKERLVRFYRIHAPARLAMVGEEVRRFEKTPDDLFHCLEECYGKDPHSPTSLVPSRFVVNCTAAQYTSLCEMVREILNDRKTAAESEVAVETYSSPTEPARHQTPNMLSNMGDRSLLYDRYWHWRELPISALSELNLLHWEIDMQRKLSGAFQAFLLSVSYYLSAVVLTSIPVLLLLSTALLLPATLLDSLSMLDNIWVLACERADSAGRELAEALLEGRHGGRPVTLVGHSLGARVIFACLVELADRAHIPDLQATTTEVAVTDHDRHHDNDKLTEKEPVAEINSDSARKSLQSALQREQQWIKAIVKDVVLLGAPVHHQNKHWTRVRALVGGRLINGYSCEDAMLAVVYRYERMRWGVCGLEPVPVEGVENVNLTHLVTEQQLAHTQDKKDRKYRYMKIGAVAVGAGAVIAVTAGMAAPAVAAALILMGTSAATAASVAGSMAMVFGGTGAGLAGYKMIKRTRGLTDFEIQQYDEKNRIAVMVVVSGWMDEAEDDKRTMGVVPSEMGLKERLMRFYKVNDPSRLSEVTQETRNFHRDPESLYAQLKERYGKDPMDPASLTPPLRQADPAEAERLMKVITECIDNIAQQMAAQEIPPSPRPAGAEPLADTQKQRSATMLTYDASSGPDCKTELDLVVPEGAIAPAEAAAIIAASSPSKGESSSNSASAEAVAAVDGDVNAAAVAEWDAELEAGKEEPETAVHLADEFKYWHWRETSLSSTYELTMLHWEAQLQKDLGKSIMSLLQSLTTKAAEKALAYTVVGTLLAAVSLPMALIGLLDYIDSLWSIAVERAEEAGKELANALLLRPHGHRPVTLVGYSMGCRVIFSCLKELARHLPDAEREMADTKGRVAREEGEPEDEEEEAAAAGVAEEDKPAFSNAVQDQNPTASEPPKKKGLWGHAASLGSGVASLGSGVVTLGSNLGSGVMKVGGQVVRPISTLVTGKEQQKDAGMDTRDLKSLIGDVVLLGAPLELRDKHWARVRTVVSGRLINGYSRKDLVLSVIYRYKQYKIGVCGIAPVKMEGVENIDLTHLVTQHMHYCSKMKEILEEIDLTSPYYCATGTTTTGTAATADRKA